jgi:type IV secretory pathway TraG/TraD family ATPase VirD4
MVIAGLPARLVEGFEILDSIPPLPPGPIRLPTADGGFIPLTDEILSQHVLLVGGIGQGKTNVICHLLAALREHMTTSDIAVVFDPKGDYHKRFFRQGDVVVNDPDPSRDRDLLPWNLLAEVRASRTDLEETTNEIGRTLFDEAIECSQNPFFPLAAKDLFVSSLTHLATRKQANGDHLTNAHIVSFWNNSNTLKNLQSVVRTDRSHAGAISYIDTPGVTTQGVLASVAQVVNDLFVGRFKDPGTFSIRETIRGKGARCVFLEYDVSTGKALAPVYKILVDLAIKEALSRKRAAGRVFFVIDEFRLLPHLMHMDHGVNFGRSEGAHFIVGMQNIAQVRAAYGPEAASILSAFNTVLGFRVTDEDTRAFVKGIAGKNRKLVAAPSLAPGPPVQQIVDGYVVEDHDVWNLRPGEAICVMPGAQAPFRASLALYRGAVG